jgi:hypothetical protein
MVAVGGVTLFSPSRQSMAEENPSIWWPQQTIFGAGVLAAADDSIITSFPNTNSLFAPPITRALNPLSISHSRHSLIGD